MQKKNAKTILTRSIVLPEVYDELAETAAPVDVICSAKEGCQIKDVIEFLKKLDIKVRGKEDKQTDFQTDFYVFATLRNEKDARKIDKPPKSVAKQCIDHVWLDKPMTQCVSKSQKTINAPATRNLFSADGEDINWAVLDTGIDISHSWFAANNNCDSERQFDLTGEGGGYAGSHGTHVAGIITKIAPAVKLWDYKVLGANGGSSSTIIRAMYAIRKRNFDARKLVIHGVNMSLGGPVQVGSYGCGWSPECQEANRLMASGVVVCVAAGNEGYKHIATVPMGNLNIFKTFVDLGITDPGNAEDVITVGSVHKINPHTYGPSFFSSKGPTGDGRFKPDCVAPGEDISSAKAGSGSGVVEMDGTSMATPHVSGAIALFLSAKPEFKGRAQDVKEILLKSCTDLKRDRNFQGAGLVDVLRMIQSV